MAEQQQQTQDKLQGIDIAKVLREQGPIVKCVVLRATKKSKDEKDNSNDDSKPSATATEINLEELTDEIEMDTTPKKNEVEKVLGGPFTFVGQYEEEGIMLMARRGWVQLETDEDDDEEEEDKDNAPPKELLNPHKLQPPFEKAQIYGDILVIKVAEMDDDEDEEATGDQKAPAPTVVSNDEFFQNYTKEQYLKFAARTDVVAPVLPDVPETEEAEEEVEDDDDDEEEENDEECEGEDDSEDEEDEASQQAFMMQLLMTNVLKQFREKNGRGPSSEEVLVLRMTVAEKLGITLPSADNDGEEGGDAEDDNEENKPEEDEGEKPEEKQDDNAKSTSATTNDESTGAKRENDSDSNEPKKRVKFGEDDQNKAVLAN